MHVDVHLLRDQWNCSDMSCTLPKKLDTSLAGLDCSATDHHRSWMISGSSVSRANCTCSSTTASAASWLLEASPVSFRYSSPMNAGFILHIQPKLPKAALHIAWVWYTHSKSPFTVVFLWTSSSSLLSVGSLETECKFGIPPPKHV